MSDVDPLGAGADASIAFDTSLRDDIGDAAQDTVLDASDASDTASDGAFPDSGETVYVDVDQHEVFTIDPDTGDKETIDPSDLPDSSHIEIVDDHQDDTFNDELTFGSDPDLTTVGDDPSTGADFNSISDDDQDYEL